MREVLTPQQDQRVVSQRGTGPRTRSTIPTWRLVPHVFSRVTAWILPVVALVQIERIRPIERWTRDLVGQQTHIFVN